MAILIPPGSFFAAAFALPPGIFVVAAALLAFLLLHRRWRRRAVAAGLFALLLYLASANWLGEALIHRLEYGYAASRPAARAADVIVVLGEGAVPGTPGLFGRGSPSGSTARGPLAALALHRRAGLPILLSGGAATRRLETSRSSAAGSCWRWACRRPT